MHKLPLPSNPVANLSSSHQFKLMAFLYTYANKQELSVRELLNAVIISVALNNALLLIWNLEQLH